MRKRKPGRPRPASNRTKKSSPPEYSQKLVRKKPGELIRLNRFIANSGICSRREADKLIESGQIKVNDKVMLEMGYKVKPTDKIYFKGKQIRREKMVFEKY